MGETTGVERAAPSVRGRVVPSAKCLPEQEPLSKSSHYAPARPLRSDSCMILLLVRMRVSRLGRYCPRPAATRAILLLLSAIEDRRLRSGKLSTLSISLSDRSRKSKRSCGAPHEPTSRRDQSGRYGRQATDIGKDSCIDTHTETHLRSTQIFY